MVPVEIQLYAFLVTVLTGIALALAFDVSRVVRGVFRLRGRAAQLADAGLWLAGALLAATGLFLANWGEIRYYVVVGLALGAALYFTLASATVAWTVERILLRLRALARWLRGWARRLAGLGRRAWRGFGRAARAARRFAGVLASAGRRGIRAVLWPARVLAGFLRRAAGRGRRPPPA